MSTLFRREMLDDRRDVWLGHVQLVHPLPIRFAVIISLLLLSGCLTFAALGSYTRRVHASGVIMPQTGLITIASPAVGIISSAGATEGQKVHADQLLYVIDLDATSATGPTQQQVIADLIRQKTAWQRERSLRQSMAKVEKQSLISQLANLQTQYERLATQLTSDDQILPAVKAAMDRLRDGAANHVVANSELQSQTSVYAQLLGQQTQFQQDFLSLEGKIADTNSQLAMFDDKLAKDISEIDRSISQLDQQIAEGQAKRTVEVLAPRDGVLTAVRAHLGQAVNTGSALVTLLPSGLVLQVDLYANSSAIGFIREGAPVLLRYAAFPFQRFGLYEGHVKEVTRAPLRADASSDAMNASATAEMLRPSDTPPLSGSLYRIVVEPKLQYVMAYGSRMPLEPGMEVEADIALDSRRLYQWAFDPLYRARSRISVVTSVSGVRAP
jgi:membrane fusion protein